MRRTGNSRKREHITVTTQVFADTDWLIQWQQHGTTGEEAIARFLHLPALEVDDMIGMWVGQELATNHPIDGLMPPFGWHGKNFVSADEGHPLIMRDRFGFYPLNPFFIPLRLLLASPRLFNNAVGRTVVRNLGRFFASGRPKARLRPVALGGTVSAAMIYDEKPIIDHFRRIDDRRCLGLMEHRDFDRPFFFLLTRE
ncbi:DUF4334 domain-containing protein [Agrobacterium vitis]|uniref:DUF4334 domain-containing protein n=1 Tax=Agrobacterium vitis TaxID=373 RepID=A0ABD6GH08_AGRVI|nr:DUF4334 domain-containing protein [Agrobacterium vitis]MUO78909.1 DUF4334 domain-containing protein [Agrobacterium vitis]MUO94472.1 DUF4334 domain-containing protein [Agrobacterium vitis]MUP06131.1 DUF4334 domain-containing protein [Agrobacterium vitis]MUZ82228.1 DUF4334 domain-containing protein [Agrobacterium vitis]MVA11411.1 DUF4334 domain-containing protein [Agrobacterium vitis]